MAPHPLDPVFHPRSVAVVGASSRPGAVSFVNHLIEQGCPNVYPVNPRGGVISGLPVYPTLDAIPGPVDHVISSIPANLVEPMLEQAGAKGGAASTSSPPASPRLATPIGWRCRSASWTAPGR